MLSFRLEGSRSSCVQRGHVLALRPSRRKAGPGDAGRCELGAEHEPVASVPRRRLRVPGVKRGGAQSRSPAHPGSCPGSRAQDPGRAGHTGH